MCGIAGHYSPDRKIDGEAFKNFLNSLTHRGPDGFGISSLDGGRFLLGHRRLAILDTGEGGRQPMSSRDGRFTITFNGEIYNFLELRRDLELLGYSFLTNSDTEVILAAYAQWGEKCQERFNGMWAFAIWDQKERILFLSRDRFGVKPLFYLRVKKELIFASELKAFMRLTAPIRPEIDPGMIAIGETIESARKTILRNVMNLNAGHQMVFRVGTNPEIKKWWRTSDHLVEVPSNYPEQVQKFRELFLDACRIRMRSDVAVGTALSGGLDSSSVICGMANVQNHHNSYSPRQAREWRKAFVLDYINTPHSERKFAEQVIHHVGAEPNILEIEPNHIDPCELTKAIFDFEGIQQPALGPWAIYREMRRKGIYVSIDGHGGDELLGGYFHYCQPAMVDAALGIGGRGRWLDLQAVHSGLYQAEEGPDGFTPCRPPGRFSVLAKEAMNKAKGLGYRIFPVDGKIRRFAKISKNRLSNHGIIDFWKIKSSDPDLIDCEVVSVFDRLNQSLYSDFHSGMLPNILRNFDRLSMAHGVEIRAPLLDWRLVTYAFSLPSSSKLGNGFTKRILRDAMVGLMPEAIRVRKSKIGFASPMQSWLQGSLKSFVMDTIQSTSFVTSDLFYGGLLAREIEKAYSLSNYRTIESYWQIIQASIFIKNLHSYKES
jgi:asparagine synthase (glutamine-hydrolysing)